VDEDLYHPLPHLSNSGLNQAIPIENDLEYYAHQGTVFIEFYAGERKNNGDYLELSRPLECQII
jgi:hypothetical protein